MLELDKIYNMDCIEGMKQIPDNYVDLVLTDPPYNHTKCDWDYKLNLNKLWNELKRVGKSNCAYLFTSIQPFNK